MVWSSSTDIFGFAFSLPGSGSSPAIAVAVGFSGEPHTGHYTGADSGVQGGAAATRGSSSWSTASFDLNLTSVTNATAITSGKGYSTDGTFDATLAAAPESGASGTVTMHVVF